MKTLLKISIFVFFVSILTVSCKKDDPPTDLDKVQSGLTSFVETYHITKCRILEYSNNSSHFPFADSEFKISDGFLTVYVGSPSYELRYNLKYLYSYRLESKNVLYMEFVMN